MMCLERVTTEKPSVQQRVLDVLSFEPRQGLIRVLSQRDRIRSILNVCGRPQPPVSVGTCGFGGLGINTDVEESDPKMKFTDQPGPTTVPAAVGAEFTNFGPVYPQDARFVAMSRPPSTSEP